LTVCVFPGWELVRASFFLLRSVLINDDLPTFDFPEKANSHMPVFGKLLVIPHTVSSSADLTTI
jgi:hypothetical protein